MDVHKIAVIPGDGVGPEVIPPISNTARKK